MFEASLGRAGEVERAGGDMSIHDRVRRGVVLFMGTTARHLDANDDR